MPYSFLQNLFVCLVKSVVLSRLPFACIITYILCITYLIPQVAMNSFFFLK